jgi:hypothetical protein
VLVRFEPETAGAMPAYSVRGGARAGQQLLPITEPDVLGVKVRSKKKPCKLPSRCEEVVMSSRKINQLERVDQGKNK